MSDRIRVGIIGAGANTRLKHIPGLRMQNSVELVALANRTEESSRKAAKELDIPKIYTDWTELVQDPSIDAVCATPALLPPSPTLAPSLVVFPGPHEAVSLIHTIHLHDTDSPTVARF